MLREDEVTIEDSINSLLQLNSALINDSLALEESALDSEILTIVQGTTSRQRFCSQKASKWCYLPTSNY